MEFQAEAILSVLKRILKEPKREYAGMSQYEYNCPTPYCRADRNKFNLSYSANHNIFRCWKCNYSGVVHIIAEDYGTKDDVDRLRLLLPRVHTQGPKRTEFRVDDSIRCELPEGYVPLSQNSTSKMRWRAMKYLEKRKVDKVTIDKLKIGYTETGPRQFRIIIPSYNDFGHCNYYEARSFIPSVKPSYMKPDSPNKLEIIFNVGNINFDLPVYLVEGVFDMMPIINAIPLLGKDLSDILISKFLAHKTKVIICLDEDALKDSVALYKQLEAYGLDVYFVEVKDDIAKFYEDKGRDALIMMLRSYTKLTFKKIMELATRDKKKNRGAAGEMLAREWESIMRDFNDNNLN